MSVPDQHTVRRVFARYEDPDHGGECVETVGDEFFDRLVRRVVEVLGEVLDDLVVDLQRDLVNLLAEVVDLTGYREVAHGISACLVAR